MNPPTFVQNDGPYMTDWSMATPPRPQQEDILNALDTCTTRLILCEAPTGIGKSGLCTTIAQHDSGIILTPQKSLQDQYQRDWPNLPILKGMPNYSCSQFNGLDCMTGKAANCRSGSCPYAAAKNAFMTSRMVCTNYAYLFAALKTDNFNPGHRDLLCDEGHVTESALISAATVEISTDVVHEVEYSVEWPVDLETAAAYADGMVGPISARISEITKDMDLDSGRPVANPKMSKILVRLQHLLHLIDDFLESLERGERWVFTDTSQSHSLSCSIKPLMAGLLYQRHIAPLGKRVFMTSATLAPAHLLNRWMQLPADSERIVVGSPFDLKNRPVRYWPTAALNYKNMKTELPVVARRIERILEIYKDHKGVIHCPSFAFAEQLGKLLSRHRRILVHRPESDRAQLIQDHINSNGPSVLMSPSMMEGLDLYDDLSRFTIFPKLPYASLGDPWVKERADMDQDWYGWSTLQSIIQGVGRSIRHDEDWADSYILDAGFGKFFERVKHMCPQWFADSLQ